MRLVTARCQLLRLLALALAAGIAWPAQPEPPPAPADADPPMADVYAADSAGAAFYDRGQYADALPQLLAAAQRGFKLAQAKVGDIYLHGRGVPRDANAGLGWLGAAARPPTSSAIADYYQRLLAQLPESQQALAAELARRFTAAYGGDTHGVACQLFGTVVEELRCRFLDDPDFADAMREDEYYAGDAEDHVEEMVVTAPIVTAPAPAIGAVPSGEYIAQVYDAANQGAQLYREKRYKEALPFLTIAAKRGFKWAQASAADIHLHGRGGVPRDLETGIGWLGVAAQPRTTNSILAYFKETVAQLPPRFTDEAVDAIVGDYRQSYGHQAHRVACRFDSDEGRAFSLRFKSLRCRFIDEATQCRDIALDEDGNEVRSQWTCQPLRGTRHLDVRRN